MVNCGHRAVIAQNVTNISRKKGALRFFRSSQLRSRTFSASEVLDVEPPRFPNPVATHGHARGGELLWRQGRLPCRYDGSCVSCSAPRKASSGNSGCGSSSAAGGARRSPTAATTDSAPALPPAKADAAPVTPPPLAWLTPAGPAATILHRPPPALIVVLPPRAGPQRYRR